MSSLVQKGSATAWCKFDKLLVSSHLFFFFNSLKCGLFRFAQISKALLEAGISAWDFHTFFLPRLDMLANDLVVNVRITVARAFETICDDGKRIEATLYTSVHCHAN